MSQVEQSEVNAGGRKRMAAMPRLSTAARKLDIEAQKAAAIASIAKSLASRATAAAVPTLTPILEDEEA